MSKAGRVRHDAGPAVTNELHGKYTIRRLVFDRLAASLAVLLVVFFAVQLFRSTSVASHVLMLVAGLSFIVAVRYIIAQQDVDPDPAATLRLQSETRQRRADAKKARDLRIAESGRLRAKERAAIDLQKAEQKKIRDAQAAEENAAMAQRMAEIVVSTAVERARVDRENRITELLILAETNTTKALKLASKDGIDLHAEAQKRLAFGSAMIGAGDQAGVELIKAMLRPDSK